MRGSEGGCPREGMGGDRSGVRGLWETGTVLFLDLGTWRSPVSENSPRHTLSRFALSCMNMTVQ